MKRLIVVLGLVLLAGCSSTQQPRTFSQGIYEGTATFVAALKAANTYAAMPRCSATVKPPCSDQATVNKIATGANKANIAVVAAQQTAADTKAAPSDTAKAFAAADDATKAFAALIPAAQ